MNLRGIKLLRHNSKTSVVQELAAGIRQLEQTRHRFDRSEQDVVSTGIPSLDSLLPQHGMLRGTLTEWISWEVGCGAMTLAVIAAREAQKTGPVVIIDSPHCFHVPASNTLGLNLNSIVVIRPKNRSDAFWAAEQALRCTGVGTVLLSLRDVSSRDCRRLQLAAETGNSIGLLVRSGINGRQSSWADMRLQVAPMTDVRTVHSRRLQIKVLHAKGCYRESTVILDVCDETGAVRLASELPVAAVLP
jgi:protein ImuA